MKLKITEADKKLHADICDFIKAHLIPDTSERALAIASQIVGQILALQDQRTMTSDKGLDLILVNIELGNQQVIKDLRSAGGRAN